MYKFDAQNNNRRRVLTTRPRRVQISVLPTSASAASEFTTKITWLSSRPFWLDTIIILLSNWTLKLVIVKIQWVFTKTIFGHLVDRVFSSSLTMHFLLNWFEECMTSFSNLVYSFSLRFWTCSVFLYVIFVCFSFTTYCLLNSRWTTFTTR